MKRPNPNDSKAYKRSKSAKITMRDIMRLLVKHGSKAKNPYQ